jgi:hypothetical protein
VKEKLDLTNTTKTKLETETLILADRLTQQQQYSIEASHLTYVKRYKYMSYPFIKFIL